MFQTVCIILAFITAILYIAYLGWSNWLKRKKSCSCMGCESPEVSSVKKDF